MRIRRVDVGSYGRMRDRSFEVSEGMTVFHGPNESGKTTLMEFVRNTLVPTRKNDVYPERSKTDSGSVTVDDGGTEKVVTLTYRTRGGDVPECIDKLDPALYRSIYAMNAESLGDRKLLDSGELAQRFLTVPGSGGISDAMERMSDRVDSILGKTKSSDSELMRVEKELRDVNGKIWLLHQKTEQYGELCRRKEELEARLRELDRSSEADGRQRDLFVRYQSQAGNYESLAELRAERESLGVFSKVTADGEECYRRLDADLEARRQARDKARADLEGQRSRLGGTDPGKAEDLRVRMEDASGELSLYQSRKRNSGSTSPPEPVYAYKPDMHLVALGVVLAAAGLVLSFASVYTVAVSLVGAAVAVAGFVRKVRVQTGVRAGPTEDYTRETEAYEREVLEIMRLLGREHTTVDADVQVMRSLLGSLPAYRVAEGAYRDAREAFMKADMEMMQFTNGFGGRDRFLASMKKSREADRLDASIAQLSEAIRASGLDPM